MASHQNLPEHMKALVLSSTESPPEIKSVPTPQPQIGSAIVRVLAANVISYMRDIYNGKRNYPYPKPLVPGTSGVGRVVAIGPDATKLKPGDLVLIDVTIRSRDNPEEVFLAGIHDGFSPGSKKLMADVYRDWNYAEYCRVPLESLIPMDEKRLTSSVQDGGLGYQVEDLACLSSMAVPFGGLVDIELRPGQTVVVAPATGAFGGAAVLVALAMGARVIAMGRNVESLKFLKTTVPLPERVELVPITGDVMADCQALKSHGPIDAYYDIGPPEAHASTHIKSCILALRHSGRVSLMAGYAGDVSIPHGFIMHRNIRLYGKWMFERADLIHLVKMVESGILKLGEGGGHRVVEIFPLEDWKAAWDTAAANARVGEHVIVRP